MSFRNKSLIIVRDEWIYPSYTTALESTEYGDTTAQQLTGEADTAIVRVENATA